MSLVLQPGNSFTIVRQIPNHLDTDVNYVQAVIRNASTDAIIDTIQLTDKGGQRFSKNWQVPADPSGQGFYVSIVTSVYTDAGYTTKNGNYGDDENTYLIQDRITLRGAGGSGIDSFTVRKIIQEELAKSAPNFDALYGAIGALQREVNRVPKDVRWDDVLGAIDGVRNAVKAIPTDTPDDAPVLAAIGKLKTAIADKEVTPETDLSPVLAKLEIIVGDETAEVNHADVSSQLDTLSQEIQSLPDKIKTIVEQIELQVEPMKAKPIKTQPEPVPFDITKFAS